MHWYNGERSSFYYITALVTNKIAGGVTEGTISETNDYTDVFYAG